MASPSYKYYEYQSLAKRKGSSWDSWAVVHSVQTIGGTIAEKFMAEREAFAHARAEVEKNKQFGEDWECAVRETAYYGVNGGWTARTYYEPGNVNPMKFVMGGV